MTAQQTCRKCFGDQTMWVRDANGKSREVPCVCANPFLTQTPPAPLSVPVQMEDATPSTAVKRPEWSDLKAGDVVWMPMEFNRDGPSTKGFKARATYGLIGGTQIALLPEEYNAMPPCPLPVDDRYRVRRYPDEMPDLGTHILRWDPMRGWWANIGSLADEQLRDGDYWRFPLPPPP